MQPFVPKRVEHALTEINEFRLNTMARAEQREHFDSLQREREMKAMETRQQVCSVYTLHNSAVVLIILSEVSIIVISVECW